MSVGLSDVMLRNKSSFGVVRQSDRLGERVQWLDHGIDGLIIRTQFLIRPKIFLFFQAPRQALGSLGSGTTGGEISLTLPFDFEVKNSWSPTPTRKQCSQSAAMPVLCLRTHWRVSYALNLNPSAWYLLIILQWQQITIILYLRLRLICHFLFTNSYRTIFVK